MTAQHTPGPWRYGDNNDGNWRIYGPDGKQEHSGPVAEAMHRQSNTARRANASLISAAPDMLAALAELIGEWDEEHSVEDQLTGYTPETGGMEMARAAIAKATQPSQEDTS